MFFVKQFAWQVCSELNGLRYNGRIVGRKSRRRIPTLGMIQTSRQTSALHSFQSEGAFGFSDLRVLRLEAVRQGRVDAWARERGSRRQARANGLLT